MKKINIKSSFIKKLFFSLILIYLSVFILLFIFQGLIFRTFYTQRTISNTKEEISILFETINSTNLVEEVGNFSQETQTTSIILPISQFQDITKLGLDEINVEYNSTVYTIFAPILHEREYHIGDEIVASLYYHSDTGNYVPSMLRLNGSMIIQSRMHTIDPMYSSLISGLDSGAKIQINGEITNVSSNVLLTSNIISPIISNEVINIVAESFDSTTEFDEGFYYYTSNDDSKFSNLVFVANTSIDGESNVLISVYPMSHIEDIVDAVQIVNIYIFSIVLALLIGFAFVSSKQFSKPLLFINKATKDLSNLDFSNPLIEINTQDEFSELAKNINSLSLNLKSTLERLNEQNIQLSTSLDRENKNENTRRDFVSGMSHELKTPLSVIQASAEALEKNIFETEEERITNLSLIQQEVQKTNKLINNMITIYNLDNPNYTSEWKEINLSSIVKTIDESLKLLYTNSSIEVKLTLEDSIIMADQMKMELIVSNLFTNAIKYTPKGSKIEIKVLNLNEFIKFEIINYGTSIDNDKIDKLFDAFYRVDKSRSRAEGSTGLGLYIVQQTLSQIDSVCMAKNVTDGVSFSFQIKK